MRLGAKFGTRAIVAVFVTAGLMIATPQSETSAEEAPATQVIEACYSAPYSPDQRLPFAVSQDEWCHPLFAEIEATTEMGGVVTISWEPASDHVYWYCGPNNGKQVCPINEYRVEASNYGAPVRCSVGSSGRNCTLRGLTTEYTHPVTLSAYLANGNWFRVHLLAEPCCKIPSSPISVNALASQDAIDASWSAPHFWGGASSLTYSVSTEPPSGMCTTEGLSCRLEGLTYNQTYTVVVRATNPAGSSPPSYSAPVWLPATTASAPRDVATARGKRERVIVRWSEPESVGGSAITGYVVRALPGKQVCRARPEQRRCVFRDLRGGKTYSFTVQATNSQGGGLLSSPTSVTVKRIRQEPPIDVTAQGGLGSIAVSWQKPAEAGSGRAMEYVVETTSGRARCVTRGEQCNLTGLAPGKTYEVSVVARGRYGVSEKVSTTATTVVPVAQKPKPVLQIG